MYILRIELNLLAAVLLLNLLVILINQGGLCMYVYSQNKTQPISGSTTAKPLSYPNKPRWFMYV